MKTPILDRFAWELVGFLRQTTVSVAVVLCVGVIIAVTETFPLIVVVLVTSVPGQDTFDVLAAVAFMHRQWWHW